MTCARPRSDHLLQFVTIARNSLQRMFQFFVHSFKEIGNYFLLLLGVRYSFDLYSLISLALSLRCQNKYLMLYPTLCEAVRLVHGMEDESDAPVEITPELKSLVDEGIRLCLTQLAEEEGSAGVLKALDAMSLIVKPLTFAAIADRNDQILAQVVTSQLLRFRTSQVLLKPVRPIPSEREPSSNTRR